MIISPVTKHPVVGSVFGEPRNRYVQCPGCCKEVFLGAGPFRGHMFSHDACGQVFHVCWNAKVRVRT